MRQEKYLEAFKKECEEQATLTTAKGEDYAGKENVFANFELIEHLTSGRISTEEGILVRMSDKLQRTFNIIRGSASVNDESVTDTLRDLSIYAKILKIYLDHKKERAVPREILPGDSFVCSECGRRGPFVAKEKRTMFGDRDFLLDTEGGAHLVGNCTRFE